jgi:CRP/FNR family transcriptional regulator, anaerobic regulatory protein
MSKDISRRVQEYFMNVWTSASLQCPPPCASCRLRQTEHFTSVKAEELAFIEAFRSGKAMVPAGGTIIPEQKATDKLFTLYAGWAFRYKTLSDGRRQILNFLLPGDFIGLQQEFSDGAMHGIEAVTEVALCVFVRDGLWELFRQHPRLAYDITWLSARGEGMVDDNLVTTGQRNATERVAVLLMHLYRRLERIGLAVDGSIEFPINQQHIADALGLSLVHTNKTLRRLQQLGLHEMKNGRLRLLNPRALQRIADYYDTPPKKIPLL